VTDIENANTAAIQSAEVPMSEFEERYVEELGKLKDKVQASGNLDGVIKVQSEIENFADAEERDYSALPGLKCLREISEESSARLRAEIQKNQLSTIGETIEKLDELKAELTKNGEIKNALGAGELRKQPIERRAVLGNSTGGTAIASDPLTRLWSLRSQADFELIREC